MASAMPMPSAPSEIATRPYPVSTSHVDSTYSAPETTVIPIVTTTFVPIRCGEHHRELRGEHHADRDGQHPNAGLERGEAHHRLEVRRQEVDDAHQREEDERHDEARSAEAPVAEHAHVEHRVVRPALPGDEQRDDRAPIANAPSIERVAPAALGRLDQAPHDRGETRDREPRARAVEPWRLGVARLRDQERGADRPDDDDRDVDEEDAAPVEVLDQAAAGDRADRDADAGHGGPDRDRLGTLVAGKMFVRIESVVGMIAAAPTPMSARDAISSVVLVESAASSEPAPNTTRPVTAPACGRSGHRGCLRSAAGTANTSR